MANYLPLLLVSVSHSAPISDDSHLETQPRGQVDYLSHEWQEEDVWKSWRNMTRQKNEIANGMRLENASWRTWWKQRNKLKTVTPETLNWLKDSDVTWLYGPLHTAVDWTPPPKPKPDPTSVDDKGPVSAHDRLDLSATDAQRRRRYKPILKYRSISDLLTGDLPQSYSPPRPDEEDAEVPESISDFNEQRPPIPQARSDTHLARWSNNVKERTAQQLDAIGLRKPSPPRLVAPNDPVPGSSCSSTSASDSPSPEPTGRKKHRHITFNTFVEQCIAIDKPHSPPSPDVLRSSTPTMTGAGVVNRPSSITEPSKKERSWDGRTSGVRWAGTEEDDEDSPHSTSSGSTSSDEVSFIPPTPYSENRDWLEQQSPYVDKSRPQVDSAISSSDEEEYEDVWEDTTTSGSSTSTRDEDDLEDEDDGIQMRTSRHQPSTGQPKAQAQQAPNGRSKGPHPPDGIRRRRRSSGGTVTSQGSGTVTKAGLRAAAENRAQKSLLSTPKPANHHVQTHITIAPIAPTTLKVGWDGFGVGHEYDPYANSQWMEGFGDDYTDETDYGINKWYEIGQTGQRGRPLGEASGGLVYVPKYSSTVSPEDDQNGHVWHHEETYFPSQDSPPVHIEDGADVNVSVPLVVRTPPTAEFQDPHSDDDGKGAYDYFSGPDLGEDFGDSTSTRRGTYVRRSKSHAVSSDAQPKSERERGRSRSRTPSPSVVGVASSSPPFQSPHTSAATSRSIPIAVKGGTPVSPSLLSPPQRGRSPFLHDSSSSSSFSSSRSREHSSRERSSRSSPMGSLSPDGSNTKYNSFANGCGEPVEIERGRQRTERRLSHSLSPDAIETSKISPRISPDGTNTEGQPTPTNSPVARFCTSTPLHDPSVESHANNGASQTEKDSNIVGRAVDMVNSAGAFLGLWHGGVHET